MVISSIRFECSPSQPVSNPQQRWKRRRQLSSVAHLSLLAIRNYSVQPFMPPVSVAHLSLLAIRNVQTGPHTAHTSVAHLSLLAIRNLRSVVLEALAV